MSPSPLAAEAAELTDFARAQRRLLRRVQVLHHRHRFDRLSHALEALFRDRGAGFHLAQRLFQMRLQDGEGGCQVMREFAVASRKLIGRVS